MSAIPVVREAKLQGIEASDQVNISMSYALLPLVLRPGRRFSEEELMRFCAANEFLQIERTAEGDLVVMTPAGGRTSNREGYIFRELDLWAESEAKGIAFNSNGGFLFSDGTMRAPDAAWLSSGQWNALTDKQQEGFLPVCPEFVVELRSPGDRASQVEAKLEFWMSRGVQLGWLIDPQRRLAMVYRLGQEPETLLRPELLEGEGPLAGFHLKMQRFWA